MGAHSLRAAVRLGRTDVLDQVIARFNTKSAAPFQVQELPFFHLHAQLWLLIALARIALDAPAVITAHCTFLEMVALDNEDNHVLRKHFAKEALLACVRSGQLTQSRGLIKALVDLNQSQHSLRTSKKYHGSSYYQSRPKDMLKPEKELYLDYDFDKYDVSNLSDLFDTSRWNTTDAINAWVRKHDSEITSMYDLGGRPSHRRNSSRGLIAEHHSYGEYLCWHALYAVAGEFLKKYPLVQRPYADANPWNEWLNRKILTREDGLWLSDGTDWPPIRTRVNLRDKHDKGVVLTGDRGKLLSLLGIENFVGEWLVVDGDWRSVDGINVYIHSALVSSRKSTNIANQLAKQDPFQAFLPRLDIYEDEDSEFARSHAPYTPWVVSQSIEAKLDGADSLGVVGAVQRGRLSKTANTFGQLVQADPFGRQWINPSGNSIVHSEAWCQYADRSDGGRIGSTRMLCRSKFIKEFLAANNAHLLILIILRRYESGFGSAPSRFWHTTAVVRVTESLTFTYHHGHVNELHES